LQAKSDVAAAIDVWYARVATLSRSGVIPSYGGSEEPHAR